MRFTGPEGPGYVLAFRPDLDMAKVEGALGEKTLGFAGRVFDGVILHTYFDDHAMSTSVAAGFRYL